MDLVHGAPLVGKGLLLGWSVAWPPGPVNGEMIRRGLSRGFWPAYAVSPGACSGDFTALRLGARFASPVWEIATNAATALLMLWFALRLALRV